MVVLTSSTLSGCFVNWMGYEIIRTWYFNNRINLARLACPRRVTCESNILFTSFFDQLRFHVIVSHAFVTCRIDDKSPFTNIGGIIYFKRPPSDIVTIKNLLWTASSRTYHQNNSVDLLREVPSSPERTQ